MEIKIYKATAAPSAWTFTIPPIRDFVKKYAGDGKGWVDPYAGDNSPAEITNDINPDRKAIYHVDALDFCNEISMPAFYNGVIFDPPYSYRQVGEHYKAVGKKATSMDTSANFYNRVMNAICDSIKPGGYALSFGWNTNAFGKNRGFEPVEILIVSHGGHHNDTLCTAEWKVT